VVGRVDELVEERRGGIPEDRRRRIVVTRGLELRAKIRVPGDRAPIEQVLLRGRARADLVAAPLQSPEHRPDGARLAAGIDALVDAMDRVLHGIRLGPVPDGARAGGRRRRDENDEEAGDRDGLGERVWHRGDLARTTAGPAPSGAVKRRTYRRRD